VYGRRSVGPSYPQVAFVNGIQGTGEMKLLIGRDGTVIKARVVKSIPALDSAAVEAALVWVFAPEVKEGRIVETSAHAPIVFRINLSCTPAPAPIE